MKYCLEYVLMYLLRILLCTMHLFPIKKNRIVFYSFNGKQYSCNPRRVTEYLLSNYGDQYEIIWAFKKPGKFKTLVPDGVKRVVYRSPRYYFYAKTAQFVVFNVQGFGELKRRKNQYFLQTWHASNGYKKVGVYLKGMRRKLNLLGHKDYSFVLCGCENMRNNRILGSMQFNGPIIKGTPRMDAVINRDHAYLDTCVRNRLKIKPEQKILLYAPTWRDNRNENDYGLDYTALKQSLENKFGGEWVIVIRLHPNVHTAPKTKRPYIIDATDYPDMEELVYVADAMISDYSSCIWDFSFTGRPCFLYCKDLKEFDFSRSFDMPIESWGFPLCTDMNGLCSSIADFDFEAFRQNMNKHHEKMGSYEDGKATQRVAELIETLSLGKERNHGKI